MYCTELFIIGRVNNINMQEFGSLPHNWSGLTCKHSNSHRLNSQYCTLMMVCDYSCVVWCDSWGGSLCRMWLELNICPHMHNTMLDHLWQLAGVWKLWITFNLTYCIPTCNEWFSAHLSPTCTTWCLAIYGMWLWTVMSWADQPNIPLAISLLFTFSLFCNPTFLLYQSTIFALKVAVLWPFTSTRGVVELELGIQPPVEFSSFVLVQCIAIGSV